MERDSGPAELSTASDEDFYAYEELSCIHWRGKRKNETLQASGDAGIHGWKCRNSMEATGLVGKDDSQWWMLVRKVNQEMIDGRPENYRIPEKLQGIAECYLQYQQGHRPNDLWHMVTPDYLQANMWMQLKSGDSSAMKSAVNAVDAYFKKNPPLFQTNPSLGRASLYQPGVAGKVDSHHAAVRLSGALLVVFVMMAFLFRSLRWGLLCMVPLTITILTIYGIIGISGKDYRFAGCRSGRSGAGDGGGLCHSLFCSAAASITVHSRIVERNGYASHVWRTSPGDQP